MPPVERACDRREIPRSVPRRAARIHPLVTTLPSQFADHHQQITLNSTTESTEHTEPNRLFSVNSVSSAVFYDPRGRNHGLMRVDASGCTSRSLSEPRGALSNPYALLPTPYMNQRLFVSNDRDVSVNRRAASDTRARPPSLSAVCQPSTESPLIRLGPDTYACSAPTTFLRRVRNLDRDRRGRRQAGGRGEHRVHHRRPR